MPRTENSEISTCHAISEAFLALHQQDGFETLPPSSLLHDSVPMSFVMSAGLIQVENDLDEIVAQTGGKFAFTQPCFRHFDVKQVGLDTTHLSLFHMSAAFHIGCSERETVLPRLWRFLTETLKLDEHRLWVTYLDDAEFGRDQRTYDCWVNTGVNEAHLIGLDQEHCFWRQRSTGQIASDGKKCGPHTEVFVERDGFECGAHCVAGNPGACRCGRFVEVSNSLFIENYIADTGGLIPADTVFAECVVGIERLAMVLQGVRDVHHVDRFDDWRERLEPHLPEVLTDEQESSVNVILDHLSAFVKLVEDGAPEPGRGGKKRIMRKLARDTFEQALLQNWMSPLSSRLFTEQHPTANQWLQQEHRKFSDTLQRGQKSLDKIIAQQDTYPSFTQKKDLAEQKGFPMALINHYLSSCYIPSKNTIKHLKNYQS